MQSKEYLKSKARKYIAKTMAGPGKFGIFIFLCILVIGTFETLGLTNKDKVELRRKKNVNSPVSCTKGRNRIKLSEPKRIEEPFNEKMKISAQIDLEKRNVQRNNILLFGAIEQYLFEHQNEDTNERLLSHEEDFVLDI